MIEPIKPALVVIGLGLWLFHPSRPMAPPPCDPTNGDITLPTGFCAVVFADTVGVARHIAIARNGDVYVNLENAERTSAGTSPLRGARGLGGLLALRDTTGDGRADVVVRLPHPGGTGIALTDRYAYVSIEIAVLRYTIVPGRLGPAGGEPDTIVSGFPGEGHRSRSLALDDSGGLFVNVGSYSNTCRRGSREPRGEDPCSELPVRAGIWRYDASRVGQHHPADGIRWATGVRNAVGLAWNREVHGLYAATHGRDNLHQFWPALFTAEQNAEKPSEEFLRVERGQDYGWPYCYHDPETGRKVLAPEYGGDGRETGRCAGKALPLKGFPAHWGPNGLSFYTGAQFPARYRGGAFIAFHGSWNRMPLPEAGYKVVFVPFRGDMPTGAYETFADGFNGGIYEPVQAIHRPMGLAQGPDGALFITDDQRGRIWKVMYVGGGHR